MMLLNRPLKKSWARPAAALLLALIMLGGLLSLAGWLSCRQTICGSSESCKHLLIMQKAWETYQQGAPFWEALSTKPYPPGVYLVTLLLSILLGQCGESLCLLSLALFMPLLSFYLYKMARWICHRPEALLVSLSGTAVTVVATIQFGYLMDFVLTAWVAGSAYHLLASRHFQHKGHSLMTGFCVGMGLLTKFTFPTYILGLLLWELWCLKKRWRAYARRGRLKRTLILMSCALGVALIICLPWYCARYDEIFRHVNLVQEGCAQNFSSQHQGQNGYLIGLLEVSRSVLERADLLHLVHIPKTPAYYFLAVGIIWALIPALAGPRRHLLRVLLGNIVLCLGIFNFVLVIEQRHLYPLIVFYLILTFFWLGKMKLPLLRAILLSLSGALCAMLLFVWLQPEECRPALTAIAKPTLMHFRSPLPQVQNEPVPGNLGLEKLALAIGTYTKKGYTPVFVRLDSTSSSPGDFYVCLEPLLSEMCQWTGTQQDLYICGSDDRGSLQIYCTTAGTFRTNGPPQYRLSLPSDIRPLYVVSRCLGTDNFPNIAQHRLLTASTQDILPGVYTISSSFLRRQSSIHVDAFILSPDRLPQGIALTHNDSLQLERTAPVGLRFVVALAPLGSCDNDGCADNAYHFYRDSSDKCPPSQGDNEDNH